MISPLVRLPTGASLSSFHLLSHSFHLFERRYFNTTRRREERKNALPATVDVPQLFHRNLQFRGAGVEHLRPDEGRQELEGQLVVERGGAVVASIRERGKGKKSVVVSLNRHGSTLLV